jgi:hypothetical protein
MRLDSQTIRAGQLPLACPEEAPMRFGLTGRGFHHKLTGGPIPQGVLVKKDDAEGRGVISAMHEREPVVDSRLAAVGAGAGLASPIPLV